MFPSNSTNNFNLVVAKRMGFFAHHSQADTLHKGKKKMHKKKNLHPTAVDFRLKKKEKRRRKKEETHGAE
jgi:hypothetical protein